MKEGEPVIDVSQNEVSRMLIQADAVIENEVVGGLGMTPQPVVDLGLSFGMENGGGPVRVQRQIGQSVAREERVHTGTILPLPPCTRNDNLRTGSLNERTYPLGRYRIKPLRGQGRPA